MAQFRGKRPREKLIINYKNHSITGKISRQHGNRGYEMKIYHGKDIIANYYNPSSEKECIDEAKKIVNNYITNDEYQRRIKKFLK